MLQSARLPILASVLLLAIGSPAVLTGSSLAQEASPPLAEVRQEYPQALNMAGYVLGAELRRQLLYPYCLRPCTPLERIRQDEQPLIRWESPPKLPAEQHMTP